MLDLRKPMRVGLLPREEPSAAAMRWFDLPPCMIFHTGNAWEEADGTVRLWVCVADQVSSLCVRIGQLLRQSGTVRGRVCMQPGDKPQCLH